MKFIYLDDSFSKNQQLRDIVFQNGGHLDFVGHSLDMISRIKSAHED